MNSKLSVEREVRDTATRTRLTNELTYQTGFGNEFSTEAISGALPIGQNNPQKPAFGLYAEQLSGTSFTTARATNLRTWMYRIRPSVLQGTYRLIRKDSNALAPLDVAPLPEAQRWNPQPLPDTPVDFVDGLNTLAISGDPATLSGAAVHLYAATIDMDRKAFVNTDGEMLIIPQQGTLCLITELGMLTAKPREIAVIPRGLKFAVHLPDGPSRGYVCENHGSAFRLPDLGLIGASGLANRRDFLTPVARFEDSDAAHELIAKTGGQLWSTTLDHSPFDVVAWHGNVAPYKYDLDRFQSIGSISFDHPDPSIYTVLTSPSDTPGTANADFCALTTRWAVAEHTFRPPYFHRNVMSEFMGLICGAHDAKAGGFVPGGASIHNAFTPHGPDAETYRRARDTTLEPHKITESIAFMFETRLPLRLTAWAVQTPQRQHDYQQCWSALAKQFDGDRHATE
ncbi:homogentisate 1,2-dioxygenase [Paraburkholderia xenovorans LB400]|uniref:Homogentisate 1,2-dioxygenase n=1 Tax=Paraburkholderia xenovorans (strain LB400) TaxID=266265 RepID=Q13GC2_PARXL|nr:homogentisate 1,2-dioxygenase [Paraburkholderia xenovorans]ABE36867.1 homogentisate 1,2-dioxygenase [Paraburkholderia xenovorans LB400]AIP34109.1 homogentisate 1,2-dioxygenase [Paraburkholderia xenovorans LB400]